MAAANIPNSEQKPKNRGFIPKRGQIKAQIFESLVETLTSVFSPKILFGGGGDGGADESDGNSTVATSVGSISPSPPPPTA